jgi:hypothetical protein
LRGESDVDIDSFLVFNRPLFTTIPQHAGLAEGTLVVTGQYTNEIGFYHYSRHFKTFDVNEAAHLEQIQNILDYMEKNVRQFSASYVLDVK